jgi:NAD dependent epimerase/dehydratase family enzyme
MLSKKTDSCFQNIIHLAGENVAHGRWTSKRKREMLLSSTRVTPKVLLESGYKFSDQSLDAVLRHCINSQKVQPAICL